MIFLCLNFEVSFVCKYLKVEVYFVSLVCGNLALFGKTKPSEQRKGGGRGQRNKRTDHWIQIFVNIFIFLVEERGEGKVPVFTAMTATFVKSSWPACTSYIVRSSRFQVARHLFGTKYISRSRWTARWPPWKRPSWSSSPAQWRFSPSHGLRGPPRSPGSCGSWGCRAHHAGGSRARWLPGRGGARSRSGPLLIGLGPESRITSDFGNVFNDILALHWK